MHLDNIATRWTQKDAAAERARKNRAAKIRRGNDRDMSRLERERQEGRRAARTVKLQGLES